MLVVSISTINMFAVGVRICHTWKSGINHVLSNGITPQPIVLESCSSPQKTLQVCNEKKCGFQFFCEWCHKCGRFLAHVTWLRTQLLDGSICSSFHWKLG